MTKTTWTNMEITERLMKEAQAWVNEMNAVKDSIDNQDWDGYQTYYTNAMQTLECLSILTNESYFIDTNAQGKDEIYKWTR